MIFPNLRISDLERDVTLKQEAFFNSRERFATRIRQSVQPLFLIKDHLKTVLIVGTSLFTAVKFFGKSSKKHGFLAALSGIAEIAKTSVFAGNVLIKTGLPLILGLFKLFKLR